MAETIVCAVDDSDAAGRVLDTARALADAVAADLLVVTAVGDERGADEAGASVRARLAEAREAPEVRLVAGSPPEVIMETADRRAALVGSVAAELPVAADRPVVVLSPPAAEAGRGNMRR